MEAFSKMMAEMAAQADKIKKELEEKEQSIQKKEDGLKIHGPKFVTAEGEEGKEEAAIVELNVGGRHFSTLKSTLLQYDGSYFNVMFSGKYPVQKDEHSRIFIDRPPETFAVILNWLRRGGRLTKKELRGIDKEALLIEVEYFGFVEAWGATHKSLVPSVGSSGIVGVEPEECNRLTRMTSVAGSSWGYSGAPDRVVVAANKRVRLWGVTLFGATGASATVTVTEQGGAQLMSVTDVKYTNPPSPNSVIGGEKEDSSDSESEEEHDRIPMRAPAQPPPKDAYDLIFPYPVKMKKDKQYVLSAKITGSNSSHCSAQASVSASGVTFTFTNTTDGNNNGTTATSGNFPSILWLPAGKRRS